MTRVYEIDFLPVENENQDGGKSGDAIAIRFSVENENRYAVVIIDGGFSSIGGDLVQHVLEYYQTDIVDLVISTHPDADHLNGLVEVLDTARVRELMVHQPRLHLFDVSDLSNLESLDRLIATAHARKVVISEPFTGVQRFGGQLTILGPTQEYYVQLLRNHLAEERAGARLSAGATARWLSHATNLLERALASFPIETLTDGGETTHRNNSSVITLLRVDGRRLLFTGDAGIPALDAAAGYYEHVVGPFFVYPLAFFQAPHHGSKRNVGPTVLNRILGEPGRPFATSASFVSSAKAALKHPSPKVVNALSRRGCSVCATEGSKIQHHFGAPPRYGWSALQPLPALAEDDDEV